MPYKCTACDKSFRYKVSQRTHKCPAQPPGMVVRQAGDLVQKLIKHNGIGIETPSALSASNSNQTFNLIDSGTIDGQSPTMHHLDQLTTVFSIQNPNRCATTTDGDFIHSNQTLDEIVEESYKRLGLGTNSPNATIQRSPSNDQQETSNLINTLDDIQIPSPSERFQNLCLYSPSQPTSGPGAVNTNILTTSSTSTTTDDLFAQTLETINDDSFKQLLYGNIDDLNNLI